MRCSTGGKGALRAPHSEQTLTGSMAIFLYRLARHPACPAWVGAATRKPTQVTEMMMIINSTSAPFPLGPPAQSFHGSIALSLFPGEPLRRVLRVVTGPTAVRLAAGWVSVGRRRHQSQRTRSRLLRF